MDGVIALEQASSPGRILASPAFAKLLPVSSDFALSTARGDSRLLEGSVGGPVLWLDPPASIVRPSLSDFMRGRPPRRQASSLVVADLFTSPEHLQLY